MRKKLLFLCTRDFWSPTTGKETTLYFNCKGLYELYDYEIYLMCFGNEEKIADKPYFIQEVRYIQRPNVFKLLSNITIKYILSGKWPMQCCLFYSRNIEEELLEYYGEIQPDVMLFDMVRLAPYRAFMPNDDIKKILIEDDFLAKRYERQLATSNSGQITGYLSDNFSSFVSKFINSTFVQRVILKMEIKRLLKYENTLPHQFDYITFISPLETKEYNERFNTDKAVTLTMGAPVDYLSEDIDEVTEQNTLSIVGNFAYAPNQASLEYIQNSVLPLLPDNINYYVVGKVPNELKDKITDKRIILCGYVDDIRRTVKKTAIYFSPIVFGTGIKTKVVEGMAMGLPVITNSIGAEGLDVHNGIELIIADTPEEQAKAVNLLLRDEELRNRIGKTGQNFVKKYHDWNKVYAAFGEMGL